MLASDALPHIELAGCPTQLEGGVYDDVGAGAVVVDGMGAVVPPPGAGVVVVVLPPSLFVQQTFGRPFVSLQTLSPFVPPGPIGAWS